ncbi:hypothetical protein NPIL_575021 [Nephila pilipes]|uniref:Uncharacterized protein n=1 Tax=Nephila pilipes TaxID=299642 RepID=A0A8X6QRD9_NEPPI|nr:hypothetical protein NPIL_575021 [Nephila pilipes]
MQWNRAAEAEGPNLLGCERPLWLLEAPFRIIFKNLNFSWDGFKYQHWLTLKLILSSAVDEEGPPLKDIFALTLLRKPNGFNEGAEGLFHFCQTFSYLLPYKKEFKSTFCQFLPE